MTILPCFAASAHDKQKLKQRMHGMCFMAVFLFVLTLEL